MLLAPFCNSLSTSEAAWLVARLHSDALSERSLPAAMRAPGLVSAETELSEVHSQGTGGASSFPAVPEDP